MATETRHEPPSLPSQPTKVAELARAMHRADGQQLQIAIPAGVQLDTTGVEGASLADGILSFTTLADRNRVVVASVQQELGAQSADPASVWQAAKRLWRDEIGAPNMASGRLLATLSPQTDPLLLAAQHITNSRDVFDALHLVQAALPHLDVLDQQSLIALCETEQPFTQHDMAAGQFYAQLVRWLGAHPPAARDLLDPLLGSFTERRANLLGAAWIAWYATEPREAVQRLLHVGADADPDLRRLTCWVAGRMLEQPSADVGQMAELEALICARIADEDVEQRRAGLSAASSLIHLRGAFDAALRARARSGDLEASAFIAQAVAHHAKELLQAGSFFVWLELCLPLDEGYSGALGAIDYVLSTMLRPAGTHVDAVFAFLETWIEAHPQTATRNRDFAEHFDSCTREILSHPALLQRVATQWMLRDGLALPSAAAGVIVTGGRRALMTLSFDAALLDFVPDSDLRLLGTRVLGFLLEADHMLSLALSLLRVRNAKARVYPLLWWLLYEEIGYDYRHTTIERLRTHLQHEQDADAQALLTEIAARLAADEAQLDALPRLRELAVPRALQRAFSKARGKQMDRAQREAQKESILLQLATQIHVKAGANTFSYVHDQFSEPTGFGSHSMSIELPRREVLDPVGNAYRLHRLRSAKRAAT